MNFEFGGKYLIYALADPRTNEIRYIGKSCSGLNRPQQHCCASTLRNKPCHNTSWLKSLVALGLRPEIIVLEEVTNPETLGDLERLAIVHYRSMGFRLTNMAEGGEGWTPGRLQSPEHTAKIRKAHLGAKRSPEARANISKSLKGRKLSAECKDKLSEAHSGKTLSQEHRSNISKGVLSTLQEKFLVGHSQSSR